MKLSPFVFGVLVVAVFLGTVATAQGVGFWSVSGKLTATGEKITATGSDPDEIKGWMTVGEVTRAYGIAVDDLAAQFGIPADTPLEKQMKELESERFSPTALREWLKTRSRE